MTLVTLNTRSAVRSLAGLVVLATLAVPAHGGGGLQPAAAAVIAPVPGDAARAGDDGVGGVEFAPGGHGRLPPAADPSPTLTCVATDGGDLRLGLSGAPPNTPVVVALALADAGAPADRAAAGLVVILVTDAAGALEWTVAGAAQLAPGRGLLATAWVATPGGPAELGSIGLVGLAPAPADR